MRFEFSTAHRVIFGPGSIRELAPVAATWGNRALFVLGRSATRAESAIQSVREAGIHLEQLHVGEEPTVELIEEGLGIARASKCEAIISVGGGSVIDAGKAIAALIRNPGAVREYLEVIGKGRSIAQPALPFAAVPTTAGTGSEVTRNAVLIASDAGVKVSIRGPALLPRLAIVDPELTYDVPREVTAASGLDAMAQLIEPFVCRAANPMTDALCRDGIRRIVRSIRRAFEDGGDREAREDMSLAALFSGMALANAKLGAVHGFAGLIGGRFRAPHGAVCARLLPFVIRANELALGLRDPQSDTLRRFDELGRLLTGREEARAADGVAWLQDLCTALEIPGLQTYGITEEDFPELVALAAASSSMQGNPVVLTADELAGILTAAL